MVKPDKHASASKVCMECHFRVWEHSGSEAFSGASDEEVQLLIILVFDTTQTIRHERLHLRYSSRLVLRSSTCCLKNSAEPVLSLREPIMYLSERAVIMNTSSLLFTLSDQKDTGWNLSHLDANEMSN